MCHSIYIINKIIHNTVITNIFLKTQTLIHLFHILNMSSIFKTHWSLQCRQRQSSQSLSWVSHYRFCKSGLEIGLSSSRICVIMHREEVEITWPAPFNPHDSRAIREVKAVDPGLAVWDPNSRKSSLRTTTLLPVLWRRSL